MYAKLTYPFFAVDVDDDNNRQPVEYGHFFVFETEGQRDCFLGNDNHNPIPMTVDDVYEAIDDCEGVGTITFWPGPNGGYEFTIKPFERCTTYAEYDV